MAINAAKSGSGAEEPAGALVAMEEYKHRFRAGAAVKGRQSELDELEYHNGGFPGGTS